MNCRRVRSQLSAYVDNELTGYEMFVLRDHLSHCRECRDEHYSLKTMKYLLSALPEKEPNPEWVALLAESFSRPSPTIAQRLLIYWERSLNGAVSLFVSPGGQQKISVQNRRLASALMLSAVGVFLITASFDRPPARMASDPGATSASFAQAGSFSSFPSWPGFNQSAAQSAPVPAGATQFAVIPLPPATLSGGTTNFTPPSAWVCPVAPGDRDNYLRSIDMHVIPPPRSMNSFGAPFPGPRFTALSIGH